MSVLVFITDTYPLGGITEQAFIKPEIEPLAAAFDRVFIMPVNSGILSGIFSAFPDQSLPANVTVSRTLLSAPSAAAKAISILHPRAIEALAADASHLPDLKALRHLMAFSAYVLHYRRKLARWIKQQHINIHDTVFYTFWFEAATAALATIPGLKIITRAHGHDIYDFKPNFVSPYWRRLSLRKIIGVKTASKSGADYIRHKFPQYAGKIATRYLGSPAPLTPNPDTNDIDTPLVLLNCSRLAEGKGVELQIELIKEWARRNPSRLIHWLCIGGGPLEWKIRDSTNNLPANLTVEMTGPMNNENVHKLLSTRHIDASLLLSESEGGVPVSMAESLSYGIPIITTSVGDLSEVTLKSGGLLLSGNLTTDEFCSKMNVFIPRLPLLRSYAVEFWRQHLNASPLRESWTKELASHIKSEQE